MKVKCKNCGKEKTVYESVYKKSKTKIFFCNRLCKAEWQKGKNPSEETITKMRIATSGENNGNYKDGHTYKKSYCQCGNKKDWRAVQCNNCYKRETFKGKHHKPKSKIKIGKKSKEKFTKEFKKKFREKMEVNGYWVPQNIIKDYNFYFNLSNWIEYMFDLDVKGKELIIENDVFNGINNPNGIVRDHRFSRRFGFELKIFPEILRHPCNCEILKNADNISKGKNNSISLEELFEKIINYDKHWDEQNLCIYLINRYKEGYRYERKNYE